METKPDKTPHDSDSFDRQIQRPELRTRLINLARRKGIPAADCEDVASDIMAEAIRCQAGYDQRRGSVATWTVAIGENVIRTHIRSVNAQKRKAKGGIISLDAASAQLDAKASRDGFVQSQLPADELEDLLATAKLSEKERKAIIGQQRQDGKQTGATVSRSTARRAREKMKRTKSDETFGESPVGPDAPECAYGKIPRAEHDAALLYDQLRRTSWFVNTIDCWRKLPEWDDVQAYLENERAAKRFPLIILRQHWPEQLFRYRQAAHQRDVVLRSRFETAVDIALGFPEWPRVGYCCLDSKERRQRLEQFGWRFDREPFWEVDERTFQIFAKAASGFPDPTLGLRGFLNWVNEPPSSGSGAYSSVHLIRIDRRYPVKTIGKSVIRWLAKELKGGGKPIGQSGRPQTTRMVGFACIRLLDDFGLTKPQAMSWLKERFGASVPSTPERLERAVRATRQGLEELLPLPAEIGA